VILQHLTLPLLSLLLMRSQKFLKKRFHIFQKKLKEEMVPPAPAVFAPSKVFGVPS
jgi:hypothetical protein